MLTSNGTDPTAQLTLYVHGQALDLSIKMLSLFPAENVKGEVLQPFRTDILEYLKALKPRYDNWKHTKTYITLLRRSVQRSLGCSPHACLLYSAGQTALKPQALHCTDSDEASDGTALMLLFCDPGLCACLAGAM